MELNSSFKNSPPHAVSNFNTKLKLPCLVATALDKRNKHLVIVGKRIAVACLGIRWLLVANESYRIAATRQKAPDEGTLVKLMFQRVFWQIRNTYILRYKQHEI